MARPLALPPLLALVLTACGAPPVVAPVAPVATAKAADVDRSDGERCLATTVRQRPAGWIESGRIVVVVKDG